MDLNNVKPSLPILSSSRTLDLCQCTGYHLRRLERMLRLFVEQDLSYDFHKRNVIPVYDTYLCDVLLINDRNHVLRLHEDQLDCWYTCPECHYAGFWEDFKHHSKKPECDKYKKDTQVRRDIPPVVLEAKQERAKVVQH